MIDSVAAALSGVLGDDSSPNSVVRADVRRSGRPGVTREHAERVHDALAASPWTHSTEWEQSVVYTAAASSSDPCRDDVNVCYDEKDSLDVRCFRERTVGAPVALSCAPDLAVHVRRVRTVDAPPPDELTRYHVVTVVCAREMRRRSAAFADVSFTYRLSVEWSGGCLRDAYAARPVYGLRVTVSVGARELTDEVMMRNSFVEDHGRLDWLCENFKGKIGALCLNELRVADADAEADAETEAEADADVEGPLAPASQDVEGGSEDEEYDEEEYM